MREYSVEKSLNKQNQTSIRITNKYIFVANIFMI